MSPKGPREFQLVPGEDSPGQYREVGAGVTQVTWKGRRPPARVFGGNFAE